MNEKIAETYDFLKKEASNTPLVGMITGTGLGALTEFIEVEKRIPYDEIPNFPKSTTEGHKGTLLLGSAMGRPIVALEGRFHLYEGYSPLEVTFPVRVMSMMGVRFLMISSAAGGLNPLFHTGDLMAVSDHINLTGINPLTGPNMDNFGPRFPDMSRAYDAGLRDIAMKGALDCNISLRQGVYACVHGPSMETPAETRALRLMGADAVGMSTAPEVIAAVHCGIRVMAIVVITNMNIPGCMQETSIEEVISVSTGASPALSRLWKEVIGRLPG